MISLNDYMDFMRSNNMNNETEDASMVRNIKDITFSGWFYDDGSVRFWLVNLKRKKNRITAEIYDFNPIGDSKNGIILITRRNDNGTFYADKTYSFKKFKEVLTDRIVRIKKIKEKLKLDKLEGDFQ